MDNEFKAAENRKAREERKKAYLQEMYARYRERFLALQSADASSTAGQVHSTIDAVLQRDRQRSATSGAIKCAKGCAHCCRVPVEVWPHEAVLLVDAARAAGFEIDKARLQRQSRYTTENWREQPSTDRACVFLGDAGECMVYTARPNACRKLLVATAPEFCNQDEHPLDRVERWFSWEAEILESAALDVFGAQLLPRALLAELSKHADVDVNAGSASSENRCGRPT
jgi:Fe-S-cluster containining protein